MKQVDGWMDVMQQVTARNESGSGVGNNHSSYLSDFLYRLQGQLFSCLHHLPPRRHVHGRRFPSTKNENEYHNVAMKLNPLPTAIITGAGNAMTITMVRRVSESVSSPRENTRGWELLDYAPGLPQLLPTPG